ncbi:hypothetical protein NEUTE1DRAFT_92991 [Neurospora tetrasperma FGSC 2508]|uniref:lipoyl(octanoyl) transferase n=1 Tax=Neurospora tetrasperma (strain FGSC 2508 / ATCC MYA-4615 / P0657) TaxID=510951 RepID=F8N4N5_NEUT8|nr:uncharacterized protein NEUTE1DRAFT_92991 [Neurospora tetrasperma FGSC 2508]EGO53573.1 hypothetical protein NEUTE1DRAFT_92991 [Neurospora tetrasperma FGSC 2508]
MHLLHLRLPYRAPSLYPPYALASRLQDHLRRSLLDLKDNRPGSKPYTPTIISFTPLPTYTLGRRQASPLSGDEATRLSAPVYYPSSPLASGSSPLMSAPIQRIDREHGTVKLPVSILHSPRGGLTTYHGPGQVVLWPILDLISSQHNKYTVRCYTRLLEKTTISTLWKSFGIQAFTTDDPGVWVRSEDEGPLAKVAALGVHLRRHVSGLGTAINVDMPGPEVTREALNPWARFVACGLEGKTVTSVRGELDKAKGNPQAMQRYEGMLNPPAVAGAWAENLARNIGVEEVKTVGEDEVVSLLEELVSGKVAQEEVVGEEEREFVRLIREQLDREGDMGGGRGI